MEGENVYDVVVIGAGIMGSCTAYEVAKRGHSVLLLEQFDFLHKRGSSHGETRNIRVTYTKPFYTHMVKESLALWTQAQKESGYMVHTSSPHLDFGPSNKAALQAIISSCNQNNIDIQTLTRDEASKAFPAFNLPHDSIALCTQHGGVIHASKAVAMFQSLASKHGATLQDRVTCKRVTPYMSISPNKEKLDLVLIDTNKGSFQAQKCVISAGAWTPKLVKEICGLDLPIQPLHTTISYWQIEEDARSSHIFSPTNGFPTFTSFNSDPHVYGCPSNELPGLLKVNLDDGYTCDPDTRELTPNLAALKEHVTPWLDNFFKGKVRSNSPVLAEACMYSVTPDHDFILDFLPFNGTSNGEKLVLVAAGFSGHGFKMGPLVGKIMADLCLQGSCDDIPLHHFSLQRFTNNLKK